MFNTLAVRPYVKRHVAKLAQSHALIVDYDMSLRRLAGEFFNTAWLGVNHFSFDARLAHRPRKKRRLAAQFARYDGVAALNQHMADEVRRMFGGALQQLFVLPNAIDIRRIRDNAALRCAVHRLGRAARRDSEGSSDTAARVCATRALFGHRRASRDYRQWRVSR
ncbi:Alpha-1,4-N-acetylgalactosamine transferase PglH [Candidatus Burkholderia pumila]|uniref:Alpha-1,4-N-acetylgalactosamine transferase PglH n=1 Tax=Candidatus Burkholderia pumila TaxID=1090375 RepID=A0ABR5HKQ8_9BURK|nr:Alpha-1,4-N-acetylgalactosamine transferase PglH [Candidatus Burkholderia pumila]